MGVPKDIMQGSSSANAISGETVTFSAGAAGTTGVTKFAYSPICDSVGAGLGSPSDTSISWTTGTVLTNELPFDETATDAEQLALFSNGDYAIDYGSGRLRYCKATTGTSDTVAYTIRDANIAAILSGSDVEIGAVEIKNATTDDRCEVGDADTARATTTHVMAIQHVDETGAVLAAMDANTNPGFVSLTDGTTEVDVLVANSAFGATPAGLALFGKYEATPTTYGDGDACPVLLDANGRVVLSSDIEIGAVELKNASSDDRADISDANTARTTGTHVLAVQHIDETGAVMAAMNANTNAGFVTVTDGTTDVAVTAGLTALKVDLVGEGGAAIDATNPVFTELTDGATAISASNPLDVQLGDGTTQVAVTAGLTALKIDLVGEGGAAIDATNPVFAELTDGATAISASNPLDVQLGDGTTQVAVTAGLTALKVDLVGEGGAALAANNPVFAELTDGTNAVSASNPLDVQLGDGTTQVTVSTANELHVATVPKNKPNVTSATGSGAIATTTSISGHFRLVCITLHLSAAPTSAGDLTFTVDANDGAAYDTVLHRVDPSDASLTDIVYIPDGDMWFESGDEIAVAYANPDGRTYGLRIVVEQL